MNDVPITSGPKAHHFLWRNQTWYAWRGLLITFIVGVVIAGVLLLIQQLSGYLRLYDDQGNWLVVWYGALIACMAMIYVLGVLDYPSCGVENEAPKLLLHSCYIKQLYM